MTGKLDVYLRATKVGVLEQDNAASLSFTYSKDYLASGTAKAISVSMPLATDAYTNAIAKPYFSGLLPDESARTRLAGALGISESNAFGMLEITGGECAGALALYPHNASTVTQSAKNETLDEQQLANLIQELRTNPLLGSTQDVRLSLAGAQDKLAVNVLNNKIVLTKNGDPTTHILKPGIQGLAGTAQNEFFCMTLATRMGLNAAEVCFASAGNTDYILIKRFDRVQMSNKPVQRLHQEDFCQALSIPPELKYEDEGGPGIEQSLNLIQKA
ncbi:MAG: HipA domain-containing protein, partial [Methylococcales bacterium]|nr:HipA domain-containing protein [Methylococcales bacterium]